MRGSLTRYIGLIALLAIAACDAKPKLISRQALFGAPAQVQVRLSPDGKYMSFLAPEDGVLNLWVAPRDDPKAAKALTHDHAGGINKHVWAPDSRTILYRQDRAGTQNWRVYAVNVATGHEVDLTPFDDAQARILAMSAAHPHEVLLDINKRDARWPDVYLADMQTGALTLVEQNPGFLDYVADNDLNLRFALALTDKGGLQLYENKGGKWAPTSRVPAQDALTFRLLGFDATNKRIYMLDSRGRDTSALTRYTPSTGETEILGQDPRADIDFTLTQPKTHAVQAFTIDPERPIWKVIDASVEGDLNALSEAAGPNGDFDIVDRTYNDKTWVVLIESPTEPGAYYFFNTATRKLTKVFADRPDLAKAP
jgi:dipeptidyl aminopeptidase/acylaminoacyl peptidase